MRERLLVLFLFIPVFAWNEGIKAQWVQQDSGIDSVLTDVVMIDSMTAYAVSHGRSILRTTNRGDTWFDLTAPLSYVMPWNAVAFYDSANGMAVGDHGAVFTIKGGNMAGWCRYILYGPTCLSVLYTSSASIYVGADSGRIYHSIDSGRTWSSEKISEWPIRSLAATTPIAEWGYTLYALTPYSICSKLENAALSWTERMIPALQGLGTAAYDLAFTNQGTGFIVGVGGDLWASPLILRKLASDTSWVTVASGIPSSALYGVSAPSNDVIYACGVGGSIVKSTDGGDTWTQTRNSRTYKVLPLPAMHAISFIDQKHGLAVGGSGTILYTSNGGLTGIDAREPNAPSNFVLEQNYPNPFNPSTAISYKLFPQAGSSTAVSNVTLKIFDALGREVKTLIDNERQLAGRHSLRWDGTNRRGDNVGSGIYFYQLTTETGKQTKKAVYLK